MAAALHFVSRSPRFVAFSLSLRVVRTAAIAALLLGVLPTLASATVISVDFNAQSAVTPFPVSPTKSGNETPGVGTTFVGQPGLWNALLVGTDTDDGGCCLTNTSITAPLSTGPLTAGVGGITGVNFELGTNATVGTPVSYAVFHSAGTGSTDLRRDMVVLNGSTPGPLNWRISGLMPGSSYDLVLFGQQFNNLPFNPATFTVFGNAPTLFDAQNDGNFLGVIANGSGEITGSMSFPAGNGAWSGFQISGDIFAPVAAVPEPSTLALLGFGAIGLSWQRRRRAA